MSVWYWKTYKTTISREKISEILSFLYVNPGFKWPVFNLDNRLLDCELARVFLLAWHGVIFPYMSLISSFIYVTYFNFLSNKCSDFIRFSFFFIFSQLSIFFINYRFSSFLLNNLSSSTHGRSRVIYFTFQYLSDLFFDTQFFLVFWSRTSTFKT